MKLFVWNNPYDVSYGASIVYAAADDVEQARAQAMRANISNYGRDPRHEPINGEHHFVLGEPDRIIEAPCAEIYHWSE